MLVFGLQSLRQGLKMDPRNSVAPCSTSLLISGNKVCYRNNSSMAKHELRNTERLNSAFLVNATSIYFVTAAFLPLLAKSISGPTKKMGSVINTTSNSGQLRM